MEGPHGVLLITPKEMRCVINSSATSQWVFRWDRSLRRNHCWLSEANGGNGRGGISGQRFHWLTGEFWICIFHRNLVMYNGFNLEITHIYCYKYTLTHTSFNSWISTMTLPQPPYPIPRSQSHLNMNIGTYRFVYQRRLRRACANVQTRQCKWRLRRTFIGYASITQNTLKLELLFLCNAALHMK